MEFYVISIIKDKIQHFLSRDSYSDYWDKNLFDNKVYRFSSIEEAKNRLQKDDFTKEQPMSSGSVYPPSLLLAGQSTSSNEVKIQILRVSINMICEQAYTTNVEIRNSQALVPKRITVFD